MVQWYTSYILIHKTHIIKLNTAVNQHFTDSFIPFQTHFSLQKRQKQFKNRRFLPQKTAKIPVFCTFYTKKHAF